MILDHAADFISADGVSALNMESLAKSAGISKALIYNYFPSMTELLRTLLKREHRLLRLEQVKAEKSAGTFEQYVRRITRAYLLYIEEKGLLLDRLTAEPAVASLGDPTQFLRSTSVKHVAQIYADTYDVDIERAIPVIDISFGLPAAAGHYLTNSDTDRQTIEDITVIMMLGGLEAIKQKHQTSLKPLVRRNTETNT
jgi:AcrR family transcriptional regulator